jgi:uridine phosphorylase
MSDRRAIVNPVKGRNPPQTGAMAIVVATQSDFRLIGDLTGTSVVEQRQLYMSRLQVRAAGQQRFTIVGPLIGAPFAAMVVETLAVWGVTDILFTGWCGAVSRQVKTGDIILPTSAMVDEGTSNHYNTPPGMPATPALSLVQHVRSALPHALHRKSIHREQLERFVARVQKEADALKWNR